MPGLKPAIVTAREMTAPAAPPLVGHEDRHGHPAQNVAGHAAQQKFPQAVMA